MGNYHTRVIHHVRKLMWNTLPDPTDDITFSKVYDVNPIAIKTTKINVDVMKFIQSAPEVCLTEQQLMEGNGFERCVDHPHVPNHIYYEGYYHSKKGVRETFKSVHPRKGYDFQKPALSPQLDAFLQAFRDVNSQWIRDMEMSMLKFGETSREQNEFVAELVRDRFLSDISIQVHYGDEICDSNLGWHVDAPNSLIHMAISLKSDRYLHTVTCDKDSKNQLLNKISQSEGNIYITSPSLMKHSVEYPACNFDNRIIAIQCRFLLTKSEMARASMDLSQGECANVVASVLSRADIIVPTLEQVMKNYES